MAILKMRLWPESQTKKQRRDILKRRTGMPPENNLLLWNEMSMLVSTISALITMRIGMVSLTRLWTGLILLMWKSLLSAKMRKRLLPHVTCSKKQERLWKRLKMTKILAKRLGMQSKIGVPSMHLQVLQMQLVYMTLLKNLKEVKN